MRQRDKQAPQSAEETVRDIRRATRRQFSAEEKIRIVLEGLRGEDSIAELCRKEGIAQNLYYRWSKEFLEAGKKRLAGDTAREATSDEVKTLRAEARQLKEALAEVTLENRLNYESGGRGFESFPARHDFNGLGFKLTSLSSGYPQTIEACDGVRWGGAKAGASKFRVRRCTRVVG